MDDLIVSAVMAARLVGRNEQTIRRWILRGVGGHILPATEKPSGRKRGVGKDRRPTGPSSWQIKLTDLQVFPGVQFDAAALAALQRAPADDNMIPAWLARILAVEDRLAALEHENRELKEQIERRGRERASIRDLEPAELPPAPIHNPLGFDSAEPRSYDTPPKSIRRVSRPSQSFSSLPGGLTSWRDALRIHTKQGRDPPYTTIEKAIYTRRLPAVRGRWKVPRGYVEYAFDAAGMRALWAQFHDHDWWQDCPDCPHTVAAPVTAESNME